MATATEVEEDADGKRRLVKVSYNPFFPEDVFAPQSPEWETAVRKVRSLYCAGCPVRRACLTHAVELPEPRGVWAGVGFRDRNKWKREGRSIRCSHETCNEVMDPLAMIASPTHDTCPKHTPTKETPAP